MDLSYKNLLLELCIVIFFFIYLNFLNDWSFVSENLHSRHRGWKRKVKKGIEECEIWKAEITVRCALFLAVRHLMKKSDLKKSCLVFRIHVLALEPSAGNTAAS